MRMPSSGWCWALGGSLLAHGCLLALLLPRVMAAAEQPPAAAAVAMDAELATLPQAPPAPASEPAPAAEDAAQAPPRPQRVAVKPPVQPLPPLPVGAQGEPMPAPAEAAAMAAASAPPSVQAAPAAMAAAPQDAATSLSESALPADWRSRLLGRLERFRQYPASARIRRQEGQPWLRLRIDRQGRVLEAALAQSSGVAALDAEVLALARRAQPLPPPPEDVAGATIDVVLPIAFSLQR
ncbi:energy transducer TonB [Stenotrophomonas sp. ESTM1D_MKCIP4_1]|uniref:energy transducer TonB family protein n=1 Tax=Stenotrophomonas sp. ESTM1D_MKCIP4_1 TaxID=2072414 RepID=UPI000D53F483|nr:energy transducer TonB [Stenotrophomonas sp. ESTM1D_MKCIP4_1]AWH54931.1 energy transducer TonB [Stenotrophomonas sp. ESTM1D_MKCIP4_1]